MYLLPGEKTALACSVKKLRGNLCLQLKGHNFTDLTVLFPVFNSCFIKYFVDLLVFINVQIASLIINVVLETDLCSYNGIKQRHWMSQ